MNWTPFELHTHTCHTDGQFEPQEIPHYASSQGLKGVALTDHNTISCYPAFDDGLEQVPEMIGIHGIEWTTYHGHMLVLGEQGYTDWRGVGVQELETAVDRIHAHGGLVGIAHPYSLSNPVNTGYRWEFEMQDWNKIDYIEVWSRDFPIGRARTMQAFSLWDRLLQQGYHISATSGRDWHRPDAAPTHYGTTYLGIEDGCYDEFGALRALKNGRVCVTAGPLLTASVRCGDTCYLPGDTLPSGTANITISLDEQQNVGLWQQFPIIPRGWRIIHNGRCLAKQDGTGVRNGTWELDAGWIRIELFGRCMEHEDVRIAFTNPFYIQG